MAKIEEQVSWKPAPSLSMTVGGTGERYSSIPQTADLTAPVRSKETPGLILGTNIPDDFVKLHYANAAAFGQMQYAVRPAVDVTIGGRLDYNTRYGATFDPRAGVVLHPFTRTTIKVLAGRAYLAPSPFQTYSHYGSFVSSDGGKTYTSPYWHLGNPDLKPQRKQTLELGLGQGVGSSVQLSGSVFYSRFTNPIKDVDADQAYAGTYHGWPVDYIDFPVNDGTAIVYGATFSADFLHAFDGERRIAARAALSLADGDETPDDVDASRTPLPTGGMAPVQFRLSTDVDWGRWSVAPRLSISGTQRLIAATDALRRRTLPGFATVDVNVRRRGILKNVDAFLTLENAGDARYRTIATHAYFGPDTLIGVPQNPRRITVGFDFRLKKG
jgi:outer membrane cobalamin receptor